MCIIIVKKEGLTVPLEHLRNGFSNNPDGAGFMFVDRTLADQCHWTLGKIVIKKFLHFESFLSSYQDVIKKHNNPLIVIHFRLGTHGIKTIYNVHPFRVNDNLAFCHYGIISRVPDDPKNSDTQMFNKFILQQLDPDFLKDKEQMQVIADFIGHSQLVFLSADNKLTFVRENLGQWDKGIWYSNNGYNYDRHNFTSCKSQIEDEEDDVPDEGFGGSY